VDSNLTTTQNTQRMSIRFRGSFVQKSMPRQQSLALHRFGSLFGIGCAGFPEGPGAFMPLKDAAYIKSL